MGLTKQEILERMSTANSWKELQIGIADVYRAFSDGGEELPYSDSKADVSHLKARIKELEEQLQEAQSRGARLTDTNKQLRAENKALRAGK